MDLDDKKNPVREENKREIKCVWCRETFSERLHLFRHLYANECPRLNKDHLLTVRRKLRQK